jgi:hypothetical protein
MIMYSVEESLEENGCGLLEALRSFTGGTEVNMKGHMKADVPAEI